MAPLSVSLTMLILDQMNDILCNGDLAYTTPFLVGAGAPLPILTTWSKGISSSALEVKYYNANSLSAIQQLVTHEEDFGVVSQALLQEDFDLMPDVALMPAFIFAVVPGT